MAHIKSSAKRNLLIKQAYAKNKAARTFMKTSIKKFDAAAGGGDRSSAQSAYITAVKTVDRAAAKNLIHKNNAARKKSAMTKTLNSMDSK